MKKSGKSWIAFNFDETPNPKSSPKDLPKSYNQPLESIDIANSKDFKASNVISNLKNQKKVNFNLLGKLEPKSVEDLAVHPKKIGAVETWLNENVVKPSNQPFSPILLLTGPTGCGKTATVNVLCKTMGIKLVEWINPMDQNYEVTFLYAQIEKFAEFFTQSKYTSLCDYTDCKKVTLVEDFPNFVVYNPTEFVGILEKCHNGNTPVIFICTDATSSKLDLSQKLFPEDIKEKFHITTISFNPCSATLLKTAIKRAHNEIQAHPDLFRTLPSDIIEAIISSTMGDIRCAINQYHFACLKGTDKIPTVTNKQASTSRGAKRKRNEKPSSSIKSMTRDETLGFFHGLGRVLNPKHEEINNKLQILCDFDALIDQFSTQPSNFSAFLQENYLKYFGDLGDVTKAADILSQAQVFLNKWTDRQDILVYALWISVLGLMFYNKHKVSKWNQIKAPTKVKQLFNNNLETRNLNRSDYLYYNIITNSKKFHTFKLQ